MWPTQWPPAQPPLCPSQTPEYIFQSARRSDVFFWMRESEKKGKKEGRKEGRLVVEQLLIEGPTTVNVGIYVEYLPDMGVVSPFS